MFVLGECGCAPLLRFLRAIRLRTHSFHLHCTRMPHVVTLLLLSAAFCLPLLPARTLAKRRGSIGQYQAGGMDGSIFAPHHTCIPFSTYTTLHILAALLPRAAAHRRTRAHCCYVNAPRTPRTSPRARSERCGCNACAVRMTRRCASAYARAAPRAQHNAVCLRIACARAAPRSSLTSPRMFAAACARCALRWVCHHICAMRFALVGTRIDCW